MPPHPAHAGSHPCSCAPVVSDARVAAAPAAQVIAMDVINPDHIKVTFDSIGGLDDIKEALVRAVPLRQRVLAQVQQRAQQARSRWMFAAASTA